MQLVHFKAVSQCKPKAAKWECSCLLSGTVLIQNTAADEAFEFIWLIQVKFQGTFVCLQLGDVEAGESSSEETVTQCDIC